MWFSVFNRNGETWAKNIAMKKDEGGSSQGEKCWVSVLSAVGGQMLIFFWHFAQTYALVQYGATSRENAEQFGIPE